MSAVHAPLTLYTIQSVSSELQQLLRTIDGDVNVDVNIDVFNLRENAFT
jgi:hypothetical protein